MGQDIYDPSFVADVFDRCSANYRAWSGVASFGLIRRWRAQCIARLALDPEAPARGVDLMAGTGEAWPHLLARFPNVAAITAIDISPGMHRQAVERLHANRADRITHLCANMLETDLPDASADFAISTFGLKTFNAEQHGIFAHQLARILRPGAPFSLIETTDPIGWVLRPLYRLYLDGVLPQIERMFLRGAQDFTMIGAYTRNFGTGSTVEAALRQAGLEVQTTALVGGCAICLSGRKPLASPSGQDHLGHPPSTSLTEAPVGTTPIGASSARAP